MGRLFTVVGLTHYSFNEFRNNMEIGDPVILMTEPENEFDKNAVAVYYYGYKIGYISRKETSYLFDDLENTTFKIYKFYKNVIMIEEKIIKKSGVIMEYRPRMKKKSWLKRLFNL